MPSTGSVLGGEFQKSKIEKCYYVSGTCADGFGGDDKDLFEKVNEGKKQELIDEIKRRYNEGVNKGEYPGVD